MTFFSFSAYEVQTQAQPDMQEACRKTREGKKQQENTDAGGKK